MCAMTKPSAPTNTYAVLDALLHSGKVFQNACYKVSLGVNLDSLAFQVAGTQVRLLPDSVTLPGT